jgi:enoyl-[acyl-carrier protein] reductase I
MKEAAMPTTPFSLAGKRGLIVGLANDHSIAYGCARAVRALGANLVLSCVNARSQQYVAPLAAELDAPLIICDVEQEGALAQLVEQAAGALGGFDFVIHSIAWAPAADLHGRVVDSSSAGFLRTMNISCHSFAQLGKLCEPHMQDGGSMITMTYLGADEAVPHYGMMGPVKAALESLVRYMAVDLGPRAIRVHAMSPGPILTRAASGLEDFDGLLKRAEEKSPLARLVTLDEIGNLAAFLVSDASSGMTGQTLYVDAGYHIVN